MASFMSRPWFKAFLSINSFKKPTLIKKEDGKFFQHHIMIQVVTKGKNN